MTRTNKRPDRQTGHRGAFEKARARILKTEGVCGICGKPVDFSYKYPHPLSPTVDHIIPVSKGGHPSDMDNLQLAHRCCNREKSDKVSPRQYVNQAGKSAGQNINEDGLVPNRQLEQHSDWRSYRSD